MTNISWNDDRISNTTMIYICTINQLPIINNHIRATKNQYRYTNLNINNTDCHRRNRYYSTIIKSPQLCYLRKSNNMLTHSSPINNTYYYDNHQLQMAQLTTTSSSPSPPQPSDKSAQRPAQMLPPGYKYQSRGTTNNKNTTGNTTMLSSSSKKVGTTHIIVKAGIPFILFTILSSWVVSKALDGKIKERDVSQGKASMSIRQASLEKEHDDMMDKLNKIIEIDFDNTKRIKRPDEILEERRLERMNRNKWYNRLYRSIVG